MYSWPTQKNSLKMDNMNQFYSLFSVLPRLRDQCSKRAVPLEDLLSEKGFDKLVEFVVDLDKVADLKVNT